MAVAKTKDGAATGSELNERRIRRTDHQLAKLIAPTGDIEASTQIVMPQGRAARVRLIAAHHNLVGVNMKPTGLHERALPGVARPDSEPDLARGKRSARKCGGHRPRTERQPHSPDETRAAVL